VIENKLLVGMHIHKASRLRQMTRVNQDVVSESGVLERPDTAVECRAEDDEIRRRLIERERAGQDPSDATVEVYLRQREDFVALSEIAVGKHLTVDTSRGSGELVDAVKNAMEKLSR